MQITIELEAVERLKNRIAQLEKKESELEAKLKDLDSDEIKEAACELGRMIARQYLSATLKSIGITNAKLSDFDLKEASYYKRWLGVEWWKSEGLESSVNISIAKEFKKMYIDLSAIENYK